MPSSNHDDDSPAAPVPERGWLDHLCIGIMLYGVTSLIAVLGVAFGQNYVKPGVGRVTKRGDSIAYFTTWDGLHYAKIADEGYRYDQAVSSNVAFFPGFPLAGRAMAAAAGCETDLALLLVAHLTLAGTFVLLSAYLHARFPGAPPALAGWMLLAFGLSPPTFFFRMAYSEALFLVVAVLVLYGLQRRWPLVVIALLVGAATATRPVAVALLPLVALAAWQRSPSAGKCALRLAWLLPLGCWGLAAYMGYQALAFDEPLAFAKTQVHWRLRPAVPPARHVVALATLEPAWSVYDPSSPCCWDRGGLSAAFSLRFANPLYFAATVLLIGLGAVCHAHGSAWAWDPNTEPYTEPNTMPTQSRGHGTPHWLNANEILLSAGLLLIPYVTRSHEMCFCSMARFAAVAFPVYIVVGQLLWRMPVAVAGGILAFSGFLMGLYAALFAAGHPFF